MVISVPFRDKGVIIEFERLCGCMCVYERHRKELIRDGV